MKKRLIVCFLFLLIFAMAPISASEIDCAKFVPQSGEELLKMFDSRAVAMQLLRLETTLPELAEKLDASEPQTANDLWLRYRVNLCLGRDQTAAEMFPILLEIVHAYLQKAPNSVQFCHEAILAPLYSLKGERQEIFIRYCEQCDWYYCPFRLRGKLDDLQELWGVEKLSDWLKDREENAFEHSGEMQHDSFWSPRPEYEWQRCYMSYLAVRLPEKLIMEWNRLVEEAKSNPGEMNRITRLLRAISIVENDHRGHQLPDLDWLNDFAKDCSAMQAWSIANNLQYYDYVPFPNQSENFLRRAMEVPLTSDECKEFRKYLQSRSSMMQPVRSDEEVQQIFFVETCDVLNQLLLKIDRAEEAQALMLKTREFRKKHNLPENTSLAGMTQSASGARVVEKEILDKEPLGENDPEYWQERAQYYLGRGENEPREKALRRGLESLISRNKTSETPVRNYNDFLNPLFRLLFEEKRHDDIVELFEQMYRISEESPYLRTVLYHCSTGILLEIDRADVYYPRLMADIRRSAKWYKENRDLPVHELYSNNQVPGLEALLRAWLMPSLPSHYSSVSYRNATKRFSRLIHETEDSILWDALEVKASYLQEILLRRLIFPGYQNGNEDNSSRFQEAAFRKAKGMAEKSDANFNRILGDVLLSSKPELAIPFLERAVESYDDYTVSRLADAYLKSNQGWTKVEQLILDGKNLSAPHFLTEAAKVAEKAGDTKSANRLRKRLDNYSPWVCAELLNYVL